MRTVSAIVGTFENLEGENGSMFVSGFSVHIVGDPKPTLVRYGSNDEGKLFVEIYEHEQHVWKPYLPNFDAQALRAQFGDTVLEGALKQDVLFWLELSNEDAIAEGQDLISHSHWTSAEADAGRFWTYHSISIAGRNAPITFRHTTTGDEITPLVQVHDYRTGRWEPFEIIRQYYDFESFRSTAAATGYLSELIPHLNTLTSDLPASDLRKAGGGIATQKQTQPMARQSGRDARVNLDEILRRGVGYGISLTVADKGVVAV